MRSPKLRFAPFAALIALAGVAGTGILPATPAIAADKIVVGKSTQTGLAWIPLDIGVAAGIFQNNGLDVQIVAFDGGAKMHQGMAAGSIDIGLGSGTDLAFLLKGAPEIGIEDMADQLRDLGLTTWDGNGINSVDDLKGQKIGVSSPGALTELIALDLAQQKNWGPKGVTPVYLGGTWPAFTAAMETKQVAAVVSDPGLGLQLAEQKKGRVLAPAASFMPPFIAHAMFASKSVTEKNPDEVRRFVKGWLETVAYLNSHEDDSLKVVMKVTGLDAEQSKADFDLVRPMFSTTGKWDQKGVDGVGDALLFLKQVDSKPDLSPYYTNKFLPNS